MKLDRLLGILTLLLQRDTMTAPELAARFEVSRRTISRDIDALCQAGIPLITRQGSGGGISIAEGYKLDKSVLTTEEMSSLVAALKGIRTVSEAPHIQQTLDKLNMGGEAAISLRESVVIDLASHYKGSLTEKFERIKQAIRERRCIAFDYYSEKGMSRRRVEPYLIAFQWTAWYVFGYCQERQDYRLFKLARLWDLALLHETYAPRDIPADRLNFDARLTDDVYCTALFAPSQRHHIIETYGPYGYTEEPDGWLRLSIGFTNRDYILRFLLSFGAGVKVLEPTWLKEAFLREAEGMLAHHD